MQKGISEKLRLGIFVIAGVILFTTAIYLIGNKKNLFGRTFQLSSVFRNVNGLKLGNNVRYSGINVGNVDNIEMINDTSIRVTMLIDADIKKHLKKDAVATIGSDGLVGNMIVNIIPGKGVEPSVKEGDVIQAYNKIGADDMFYTLNVSIENAAKLTAELLKITESINEGNGALGMLLNDSDFAMDFKQIIDNLGVASQNTIEAMNEINYVFQNLNSNKSLAGLILQDSVTGNQFKSIIANLTLSSEGVKEIIHDFNSLVNEMKQGDGTVNALLYDSTLVKDLRQTMDNINSGSYRFNENMEALKHNFFFKGYFKEAKKRKKESE